MNLTKENIITIQSTLIEAGFMPPLGEGVTPSGDWTNETQVGFDHYLQAHEELMAEQMVGKQPGSMEQLGASLGHAIDHGITLFEAAAKKLTHWFVEKKDQVKESAEEVEARLKAKAEEEEVLLKAKLAAAAAMVAEAANDNAPAPKGDPVITAPSGEAQAAGAAVPDLAPVPVVASVVTTPAEVKGEKIKVDRK